LLAVLAAAGVVIHWRMGLRNFIGMPRNDQRREGSTELRAVQTRDWSEV